MNELVNHPEWMPLLLDENGEATFDNASNVHPPLLLLGSRLVL